MTIKADAQARVVLPNAKPGDVFEVQLFDGGILLTKAATAKSKVLRARRAKAVVMGAKSVEIDRQSVFEVICADLQRQGFQSISRCE